ncbi:hypothetical protein GA0061100_12119 [Rhizobium hainanense]|uniref:Uncharacterized protein n=1 Tax=Rhizobium hainanense TaxID=52131 RepID=A0A1C3WIL0_9HYPH|nr:hypothetical protein GA0061100_12119 [Rhizobium hainanense]
MAGARFKPHTSFVSTSTGEKKTLVDVMTRIERVVDLALWAVFATFVSGAFFDDKVSGHRFV